MRIDWWTLALQTINALILIFLLARFLFRPVADIIAARQAEARRLLDEAASAKTQAEDSLRAAEALRADIAQTRAAAAAEAAKEAMREKDALLAAAQGDIAREHAAAQAERAREQDEERRALRQNAAALSGEIARKLLARLPGEALTLPFLDGLSKAVAALPEGAKAATQGRLIAARPLSKQESMTCQDALARAVGHPLTLAIDADPAVIAGLELETPHAAVRDSLRADLERIAARLDERNGDGV